MNNDDMCKLAGRFRKATSTQDQELLRSMTTDDVVWSLPGNNIISGNARGVAAILRRSRLLADYGVDIAIDHVVYGLTGFGLLLHNTGNRLGRVLDEHLTTVFQLRGTLVATLDSYIADVTMLDDYFAEPPAPGARDLEMVDATRSH
jgi:uncharacterized protein